MKKAVRFLCVILPLALLCGCTPTPSDTTGVQTSPPGTDGTTVSPITQAPETEKVYPIKAESDVASVDSSDLFTGLKPDIITLGQTYPTGKELKACVEWYEKYVLYTGQAGITPAYDFKISGVSVRDCLSDFSFVKGEPSAIGAFEKGGITTTVTAGRADGLTFSITGTIYTDYPVCEWTVYITNNGKENTGKITDFYALDASFESNGATALHGNKGSCDNTEAFKPFDKNLSAKPVKYAALYGKSSYDYLPFFALNTGKTNAIVGIGWTGQWEAEFSDTGKSANVKIYQQKLNAALYPSETIRSPLVSVQFYEGIISRGQNIFRQWVYNCLYRDDMEGFVAGGPIRFDLMQNADTNTMISEINFMDERGIKVPYFWMDAGWYKLTGKSWVTTGNWTPDKNRFPNGIKEITDTASVSGMKSVLWYEPERVVNGQFYSVGKRNKWLLSADLSVGGNIGGGSWYLWNLANDEALDYLCGFMTASFKEQGVSVYRQDANSDPLAYWVQGDRDFYDRRTGICENRYVTNFYKYWDKLLSSVDGLIIDNCSSGGRRLDLETIRRSVTVWRNDYCHDVTAQQLHTSGLSAWLPLHGTGTIHSSYMAKNIGGGLPEKYVFRSQMSPLLLLSWNFSDNNANWDVLIGELESYKTFQKYYYGDFYALTEHSKSNSDYFAMQFTSKDKDSGMVTVYRRQNATQNYYNLMLCGLVPEAVYDIRSTDDPDTVYSYTGERLMQTGVPIKVENAPEAVILIYTVYDIE